MAQQYCWRPVVLVQEELMLSIVGMTLVKYFSAAIPKRIE
jgi:hypothetical protein